MNPCKCYTNTKNNNVGKKHLSAILNGFDEGILSVQDCLVFFFCDLVEITRRYTVSKENLLTVNLSVGEDFTLVSINNDSCFHAFPLSLC